MATLQMLLVSVSESVQNDESLRGTV